jgi:hypothetical protein
MDLMCLLATAGVELLGARLAVGQGRLVDLVDFSLLGNKAKKDCGGCSSG